MLMKEIEVLVALGLFVVCFLLGSIPWGVVISEVFFKKDIRQEGSGNIGTTNAMRSLGKIGGGAVFLLDFGKGLLSGFLALLACWYLLPGGGLAPDSLITYDTMLALSFMGCIFGHIFSPWLGFKGGKGIAVAVGCLFVTLGPVSALIEIALFAVIVIATRYVSAGSVAAAVLCPFLALYVFWGEWLAFALVTISALVVIWAHRGNIDRLRRGTERRIGDKKKQEA